MKRLWSFLSPNMQSLILFLKKMTAESIRLYIGNRAEGDIIDRAF